MLKQVAKWCAIVFLVLMLTGLAALAFNGVPQPGVVTVEGVPRVSWRPLWQLVAAYRATSSNHYFGDWHPDDRGIFANAKHGAIVHVRRPGAVASQPLASVRGHPDLPDSRSLAALHGSFYTLAAMLEFLERQLVDD